MHLQDTCIVKAEDGREDRGIELCTAGMVMKEEEMQARVFPYALCIHKV